MPTDAERYNLLLQALATGIEDIRQAFEMAFGVVLPSAATLNEELERIARAIYAAADRPRPAPVIDDKPTTRTHFVYRIDIWTNDGKNILEHLAGVENLIVARAAYRIACERWPNARITLRQALLRYALAWPCLLLCGLGVLYAPFDRERQFLHDRISGTCVVAAD